jgi:hypothetical protein
MRTWTIGRLVLLSVLLCLACAAQAADLAGVKLPDTMEVGGERLPLNGMALGKKFIFEVYVVALYLPAPAKADEAVVEPDVPKGFVTQFLRSIRREKLVQAFKDGFEKNGAPKADKAQVEIDRFLAFVKDVKRETASSSCTSPGRAPPSLWRTRRSASRERTSPTSSSCSTSARTRRRRK